MPTTTTMTMTEQQKEEVEMIMKKQMALMGEVGTTGTITNYTNQKKCI